MREREKGGHQECKVGKEQGRKELAREGARGGGESKGGVGRKRTARASTDQTDLETDLPSRPA